MRTFGKLALASVSLLAFAGPALAQGAGKDAEEGAYADDEIVVQARRKDESAQDVPLVVNAVTAEDVAKLNLRDFKDITAVVPGLSMANNANGIGTTSSVRGVNYDVNASGNNGTIEYYLNDAPVSAAVLFTQMWDVGQIEVLRGPQGTLRGRAAPSGSITVTTRKPNLVEVGGFVEGTVNDIGGHNLKAAINVPVISDVLGVRISGVVDEGKGNRVRSINSTAKPHTEMQGGRVSVRATPVDFLELDGFYQVIDSKATQFDQAASFSLFSPGAPASNPVIRPRDRLAISAAARRISQRFETLGWTAGISAMGQKLTYVGQRSNARYTSADPTAGDPANFFRGQQITQNTRTKSKQQSHEVRLQNQERIAGMFDYVVGYFHNTLNPPTVLDRPTAVGLNFGSFGAVATIVNTKIGRTGNSAEESFFGNLTAHLGEATELSGGLRRISYETESDLFINCPNYTDCAPLAAAAERAKFKKTIYNLSLKHRLNENVMAYASFGTSWRPGISVTGDFSLVRSALQTSFLFLPPETSKSYEIGFKTNWLDNRLKLNVTAYQQDFKNYPYRSSSGIYYTNYTFVSPNIVPTVGQFNFVGAVPVRVRGVEADAQWQILDNWSIGATLNYAKGKVKNGLLPCNDLNGDGQPDVLTSAPSLGQLQAAYGANNLGACRLSVTSTAAPKWSGVFNTEFTLPVSDSVDAFTRGLWSWRGKAQNDPSNVYDDVRSFDTLNLYLGLRDPEGAWEVSLFGKNILKDRTVTSVSNGPISTSYQSLPYVMGPSGPQVTGRPSAAVYTSNYASIGMTAPREFGITARFAIGSR